MVSAKTERDVLIEYPIDVAYDTLVYLFPVRHFRLANNAKIRMLIGTLIFQ